MPTYDNPPARFDWPSIVQGDTFRAIQFNASGTEVDLDRVRAKVKDADGNVVALFDSDGTGATVDVATAGAWQFTIGPLTDAQTAAIAAGTYAQDIELTDTDGTVETHFRGSWTIQPQITD